MSMKGATSFGEGGLRPEAAGAPASPRQRGFVGFLFGSRPTAFG